MTTMTDGREVDFGKKFLFVETSASAEGVKAEIAFIDGQYRTFLITDPELLAIYAAKAVEGALARLESSSDFDVCLPSLNDGPSYRKPRETNPLAALTPTQRALVELTGKTPEAIVAWTASKTKAEVLSLRNDEKIAPILARYKAEEATKAAERAAKKGKEVAAPVDLLSDLLGAAEESLNDSSEAA